MNYTQFLLECIEEQMFEEVEEAPFPCRGQPLLDIFDKASAREVAVLTNNGCSDLCSPHLHLA